MGMSCQSRKWVPISTILRTKNSIQILVEFSGAVDSLVQEHFPPDPQLKVVEL